MEHLIDPETFVGLRGTVTPKATDSFQNEFEGICVGVRNGFLKIRDQEDDVFEVEASQFCPNPAKVKVKEYYKETTKLADFNHLILYAKGWYKKTNVLEDIRKIMEHRCALRGMNDSDVWNLCVIAFMQYAKKREWIEEFLTKLFLNDDAFQTSSKNCPIERAIQWILIILARLRIWDEEGEPILNLGTLDPNILEIISNGLQKYQAIIDSQIVIGTKRFHGM